MSDGRDAAWSEFEKKHRAICTFAGCVLCGPQQPETVDPAEQDRAAAEALAAALRALLSELPRCTVKDCDRPATRHVRLSERDPSHYSWCAGHASGWPVQMLRDGRAHEQAEAALAAWEARSR